MVAPLAMMGLSAVSNIASGLVDTVNNAFGANGTSAASAAVSKTKKTAQDFEKMFLENALDRLTANTGAEGPLGENGTGGGVYKSMLTKEYAGQIVKTGGVGIADQIYRQMLQMQERAHVG
jgi:peptidoglycan hydrolase FlgJ